MPIIRTLNQDFFKTWSVDMAYVVGFFAADGSMVKHKNGGCFIEFTSTDKTIIDQIRKATRSGQKIGERRSRNKSWKTQYRLQIGSKRWFEDLSALGFVPNKSKRLILPPVPTEYFGDFVRGYFDGDGCVYFNKLKFSDRNEYRWILLTLFISGCRPFLEVLHGSLRAHGVRRGSIRRKTRGFELAFSHRDSLALYRLMYHTGQVAPIFLPRKREELERAIQVLRLDKTMRS